MGGGGGGVDLNPFDGGDNNIFGGGNFFGGQNLGSFITNAALQYATFGILGYEDGKIGKGITTKAVDEGVGEVTGRNAARKASMDAQDAINAEKEARAAAVVESQNQMARSELNASNMARRFRRRGVADEARASVDLLGL